MKYPYSSLELAKGELYLRTKGFADQVVPLKHSISLLQWTGKSWRLELLKQGIKPDPKNLKATSSIGVSGRDLRFSLARGEVKWAGRLLGSKQESSGRYDLNRNPALIFHGDEAGDLHMISECGHVPIGTDGKVLRILEKEYGPHFMLGLVNGEDGRKKVAVCGGIGVGIDLIDNIIDPTGFYGRMLDRYLGLGSGQDLPADAQAALFCENFDAAGRPWEQDGQGYAQCSIDLDTHSLLLNCQGEIVLLRDGNRSVISLETCPLIFAVEGMRQVLIASQNADCLDALGCH